MKSANEERKIAFQFVGQFCYEAKNNTFVAKVVFIRFHETSANTDNIHKTV